MDDDVKVMIVRGNGPSFSAGYDLGGGNEGHELPHFTRRAKVSGRATSPRPGWASGISRSR